MDTDQNKSVAVDYETWKVLVQWAEDECRSVGGQIRYLVKQHGPQIKTEPLPEPEDPKPSWINETKTDFCFDDGEWQSRPLGQAWFRQEQTQRGLLVDTLLEYAQPVTNTELLVLCETIDNDLIKEITIDDVAKQTSGMWSRGLLKRRKSNNRRYNDRYEYQLTQECVTLMSNRDNKIIRKRKAT
jgi:hypothetical protein